MKIYVCTHNLIEGFHNYPDAPDFCNYLRVRHRHIFVIECKFVVEDKNREIEINCMQGILHDYLTGKYGVPCEFGTMSCEMIAHDLLQNFIQMRECSVREDGFGGALIVK